jgi:Rrf2 family protein
LIPHATGAGTPEASPDLVTTRQFTSSGAVHFSTRGEYGVRLMAELARHFGTGPVSLAEVADHEDLPRPYLEQLVSNLRDAGLVTSTRGAHGGYQLTRDPGAIRMSEVLRALEGPIVPMVCANEDPIHALDCGRTGFCNVNLMWVRVREAIVTTLESLTLADVSRGMPPAHRSPASGERAASGGRAASSPIPVVNPN